MSTENPCLLHVTRPKLQSNELIVTFAYFPCSRADDVDATAIMMDGDGPRPIELSANGHLHTHTVSQPLISWGLVCACVALFAATNLIKDALHTTLHRGLFEFLKSHCLFILLLLLFSF